MPIEDKIVLLAAIFCSVYVWWREMRYLSWHAAMDRYEKSKQRA